jgi:hypothetical protein
MSEYDIEIIAYELLALHGVKALDIVFQKCDDAARRGAEDILFFWNEVLNVMYGWELSGTAADPT